jgi:hypothetical protein
MNVRELVDHIRSGPGTLLLHVPLRLRDFDVLLQALQSSETIRTVTCRSHLDLGISEDEWFLLVKTLGRIRDIRRLEFCCERGSRYFNPFQAVAEAVNNAHSLRNLEVNIRGETFPRDQSGLIALANALREHTGLHYFRLIDWSQTVGTSLDPVLRALIACPHLQRVEIMTKCASADALRTLLHLQKDTQLILETDHWLAGADEIRRGRCTIKHLSLVRHQSSSSESTEAVKAIASALRLDRNLEFLDLQLSIDFTNEAGVALAEALTVNKTLRRIVLRPSLQSQDVDAMSASVYEAFCAMLRVNKYLVLKLPLFNNTSGDERLVESRNRMHIEQGLNNVGRGRLLSSSQTPREEWVNALNDLNSSNVDESPELNVSCLYSLLRLNPVTCMS